jgi:hypothetical protein
MSKIHIKKIAEIRMELFKEYEKGLFGYASMCRQLYYKALTCYMTGTPNFIHLPLHNYQ